MYDLCLFDLDGTLTDPKIGITKSYRYALAAFDIHEELENLEKFIGPPLRECFKDFYGLSESDTEKAVAKFREYFSKTGMLENTVYPGIPGILRDLMNNGKTLAVATNKVSLYSVEIIKHFGLDKYFAFVSGDDMDGSLTMNGKRDIILLALDTLDPDRLMRAVMIGDRRHDITGARDAGIDSIGITWGYGSRSEQTDAGATWIAENTDELLSLLISSPFPK